MLRFRVGNSSSVHLASGTIVLNQTKSEMGVLTLFSVAFQCVRLLTWKKDLSEVKTLVSELHLTSAGLFESCNQ